MFEQPLQEKQITERERLVLAGRRHVASHALEGGKDFVRRAFEIQIEIGSMSGPPTFGDSGRDPTRMLIGRGGLWLSSAHHGYLHESLNISFKSNVGLVKISEIHADFSAWEYAREAAIGARTQRIFLLVSFIADLTYRWLSAS